MGPNKAQWACSKFCDYLGRTRTQPLISQHSCFFFLTLLLSMTTLVLQNEKIEWAERSRKQGGTHLRFHSASMELRTQNTDMHVRSTTYPPLVENICFNFLQNRFCCDFHILSFTLPMVKQLHISNQPLRNRIDDLVSLVSHTPTIG